MHSSESEAAFTSTVSLFVNGVGAALMGIFPRSATSIPWEFVCGATAVVIGAFMGVGSRLCSLGIRKLCPWIINDELEANPND